MTISKSAAWAVGLGLVGAAALVGPIRGQQPKPAAVTVPAAVVGSVDMQAVLKSYDKMKVINNQLRSEVMDRQKQLEGMMAKGQAVAKEMQELQVGSAEFKAHDAEITRISGELDIAKQQAKRDFQMKESEAMATLYKEAQKAVEILAQQYNMNYVVRIDRDPISGSDGDSVMAAMSRNVVYYDPRWDMTDAVIKQLNRNYAAVTGGVRPASATTTATTPPARQPQQPAPTPPSPATKGTR